MPAGPATLLAPRLVDAGVHAARRAGGSARLAVVATPASDGDTAELFRSGSEAGLAAAYDAHGALVHTLCARAHPNAAADLTQEVFLAAWRARDRFDPDRGPLAAWLVGIAKNKIVDAYRKDGRRVPELRDDDGDAVAAVPEGRSPVEHLADRLLVTEALSTLAGRPRDVVRLAFYGQMTHEEIADETGLPLGTVKSDIRRGLARMRRYLEAAS